MKPTNTKINEIEQELKSSRDKLNETQLELNEQKSQIKEHYKEQYEEKLEKTISTMKTTYQSQIEKTLCEQKELFEKEIYYLKNTIETNKVLEELKTSIIFKEQGETIGDTLELAAISLQNKDNSSLLKTLEAKVKEIEKERKLD